MGLIKFAVKNYNEREEKINEWGSVCEREREKANNKKIYIILTQSVFY